jgi:hypothetical protein
MWLEGKTTDLIAFRAGREFREPLDVARVKLAIKRQESEYRRRMNKGRGKVEQTIRLERVARFAAERSEEAGMQPEAVAKLMRAQIEAEKQLALLHGHYAPTRHQVSTESEITVVAREQNQRMLMDPEYRKKLAELEIHAINANSEATNARWIRPQSVSGSVGLPAAPGDPQRTVHGAGGAGDHGPGDVPPASPRQE